MKKKIGLLADICEDTVMNFDTSIRDKVLAFLRRHDGSAICLYRISVWMSLGDDGTPVWTILDSIEPGFARINQRGVSYDTEEAPTEGEEHHGGGGRLNGCSSRSSLAREHGALHSSVHPQCGDCLHGSNRSGPVQQQPGDPERAGSEALYSLRTTGLCSHGWVGSFSIRRSVMMWNGGFQSCIWSGQQAGPRRRLYCGSRRPKPQLGRR